MLCGWRGFYFMECFLWESPSSVLRSLCFSRCGVIFPMSLFVGMSQSQILAFAELGGQVFVFSSWCLAPMVEAFCWLVVSGKVCTADNLRGRSICSEVSWIFASCAPMRGSRWSFDFCIMSFALWGLLPSFVPLPLWVQYFVDLSWVFNLFNWSVGFGSFLWLRHNSLAGFHLLSCGWYGKTELMIFLRGVHWYWWLVLECFIKGS